MKRKFLAASEELVSRVSKMAKSKHLTLFGVVNEALEQVLRAEGMGKRLPEILDEYSIVKMAKEAGSLLITEDLLHPILDEAFERRRDDLMKSWRETGQWFGRFFSVQFPDRDRIEVLDKVARTLIWGASDVTVSRRGGSFALRCIGPRLGSAYTFLLASFVEGLVEAFGYSVVERDVSRGVIFLTFAEAGHERKG